MPVPLGLLPLEWPKGNPYSADKVELGRLLYFDKRLSKDDTVSCASCHSPEHGYTDGAPNSEGIRDQHGNRSAPTILNRAYSLAQFWDGRAPTLEEQAKGPIANPIEMGNTQADVLAKINAIAGYRVLFERSFGSPEVTIDNLAKAIATFERTLRSGNSPYDRYEAGSKAAMTRAQVRGLDVFVNKHRPSRSRPRVTKDPMDWGTFKTPTLRDVYGTGGKPNKNLDEKSSP